jgi:hypothetical protein
MKLQFLSLLITVVIFILIVYFLFYNIKSGKLNSNIIVGSLVNQNAIPTDIIPNLEDNICKFYESDSSALNLENACEKLTSANCKNTKCCAWAKSEGKEQCYAGGKNGPTFKTDNTGTNVNFDTYYYMNKCYGNCT